MSIVLESKSTDQHVHVYAALVSYEVCCRFHVSATSSLLPMFGIENLESNLSAGCLENPLAV